MLQRLIKKFVDWRIARLQRQNRALSFKLFTCYRALNSSPLAELSVNDLKQLARRRPDLKDGCKAEIQRRLFIGKKRKEARA